MKPIKAWAVLTREGEIVRWVCGNVGGLFVRLGLVQNLC